MRHFVKTVSTNANVFLCSGRIQTQLYCSYSKIQSSYDHMALYKCVYYYYYYNAVTRLSLAMTSGVLPSALLYPKSLNIAYLTDFSRCLLHLEANLVLRKALVAAMPFGWLAVLLITLYAAVTLPICAPLTCQRHLTKSTITPYALS